jgi:CheY-like chemotaxis protein
MSDEIGAILDGIRVLYVEDDDTQSMMVPLLEMAGATVAAVASADKAVAAFRREQPDILVADERLQVLEAGRHRDARDSRAPIAF